MAYQALHREAKLALQRFGRNDKEINANNEEWRRAVLKLL